jgi:hypothetical protein
MCAGVILLFGDDIADSLVGHDSSTFTGPNRQAKALFV